MTPFSLLLGACGLSHREAAAFLNVRPDTVSSWSSGRNGCPPGVIDELRALHARIEAAAEKNLALVEEMATAFPDNGPVDIQVSRTDEEAQSRGWPCVGALHAIAGRVIARTSRPCRLV